MSLVDHHADQARRNRPTGSQPRIWRALAALPIRWSTSAGRRKRGSTSTCCCQSRPDVAEGHLDQVAHRVALAGGDDVVVGRRLLQHQPHRPDVVAGEAPVAVRFEVAEGELVAASPSLMRATPSRDLARDELEAAPRRLVVEQDAGAGEQAVALAVVDGDVVAEHLRHAVRAARVERRHLGLRHLAHLAEHLARRGLVEPDLRVRRAGSPRARASRPGR